MKHFVKRSLSVLLVLVLVVSLLSSLLTVSAATNTATRHQLCTALSSQAKSYYTGQYTYDNMSVLTGGNESCLNSMDSPLFQRLNSLMTSTMTDSVSYKSLTSYWPETDNNLLIYSDTKTSSGISREHVWPKSRASFHEKDGGCDIHHLRPEDSSVNSTRSNYTMGNVVGAISDYSTKTYGSKTVLWYNGSYTGNNCNGLVEVADNVKGDVARILLYVYVRWEEANLFEKDPSPKAGSNDSGGNDGKKVIESLDTLLEWCENDPVDAWEMKRNDLCQDVQGNRNVFIDYPEYAWLLFGQTIPNDMKTPSGEALDAEPPVQTPATVHYIVPDGISCSGTTSSYVGSTITLPSVSGVPSGYGFYCWSFAPVADTTGSVSGYSAGKSYTLTQEETTFYAVFYYKLDGQWHYTSTLEQVGGCAHGETEVKNAKEPTCTEDGYTGDTYCTLCGQKIASGSAIAATGHGETEVKNAKEPTCTEDGYTGDTYCTVCGEKTASGSAIPATGHNYVDGVCTNCGAADPDFCAHGETEVKNAKEPGCDEEGYTGDLCCALCGQVLEEGEAIPATGHNYVDGVCTNCGKTETATCKHQNTELRNVIPGSCTEDGYSGDTYCTDCGLKLKSGITILASGHDYEDGICINCGDVDSTACEHRNTELRNVVIGSCTKDGYSGDTYCADCGLKLKSGTTSQASGHKYVEDRCSKCGLFRFEAVTMGPCYFDDFSDCAAPWYHTAVDFTVANGLMKGIGDGLFDPNGSMTRAMIVTVLYRWAGSPNVAEPATFADVAQGIWYSDAIAWAQDEGIVNGISDTEFAPDQNVTREQIATILWRCSLKPELTADLERFGDGDSVSGYAESAICWAVAKGILSGDGKNLNPGKNATRAEFACMILRYLEGSYVCLD